MKKRFFQLVLTAVLSVSCVATGVNVSAAPLSSEGYSIEKVSHPERGAGETDGILSFDAMGEESNRNQSYVWSVLRRTWKLYLPWHLLESNLRYLLPQSQEQSDQIVPEPRG